MDPVTLIIIVLVVLVVLGAVVASLYNGLVRADQKAKESWSGITVQLKRRADLIPNLVESVRGYAAHESGVFEKVTAARSAIMGAVDASPAAAAKAEGELSGALKSLFAVAEAYPDLKANQNFIELQAQVTDTEDKISASRRFYNSAVNDFNAKRQVFPTNVVASMLGFSADKEFFEVSEAEQAAIEKPVEVKF